MDKNFLHPEASILEAAQLMESSGLGDVNVGNGGRVIGSLTDRDIVLRVIAKGLDPMQVRVSDVMTASEEAGDDWMNDETLGHQDSV